jgi:hypothetical protein
LSTDGVQLLSSCTEYVADGHCELHQRSVGDPHVEKIFVWRRLTPELRRTALRRRVGLITRTYHDAAKRCRLGRIVRRLTSELLLRAPWISQGAVKAGPAAQNWFCAPASFSRDSVSTDGVQLLSSCTEYVADGHCELQPRSVGDPHVEKIFVWRRLTPELSRTAARNGGVVHVTMQPSREAVSA